MTERVLMLSLLHGCEPAPTGLGIDVACDVFYGMVTFDLSLVGWYERGSGTLRRETRGVVMLLLQRWRLLVGRGH